MDKVIDKGLVAVLYSPGYGAGWYSWNSDHPECLFDPDVVEWVKSGKVGDCPDIAKKYGWDSFYMGGAVDLSIEWLKEGTKFEIDEYDGYESVRELGSVNWLVA